MRFRFAKDRIVHAETKGFTITTHVPADPGGEACAPTPVDLLLASLGTCTSYYVMRYCEEREIPMEDVSLSLDVDRDSASSVITKIKICISMPAVFPDERLAPVVHAASQCTVKRYLENCPEIETTASRRLPAE